MRLRVELVSGDENYVGRNRDDVEGDDSKAVNRGQQKDAKLGACGFAPSPDVLVAVGCPELPLVVEVEGARGPAGVARVAILRDAVNLLSFAVCIVERPLVRVPPDILDVLSLARREKLQPDAASL